ncbi:MAG: RNA-protein complex protein Nop10 [Candidatus Aenigmatarchaeota archaeon]
MRMMIKKCIKCNIYTLNNICSKCGSETKSAHPAKFLFADRYGKYRRMLKMK